MTNTFSSLPRKTARPALKGSTVRISTGTTDLFMFQMGITPDGELLKREAPSKRECAVNGPSQAILSPPKMTRNFPQRPIEFARLIHTLRRLMMKPPWDIPAAIALYNIDRWSAGYFTINDSGNIAILPTQNAAAQ